MKKFLFTISAVTPGFRVVFAFRNTSLILICFLLIASCKKDQKKLEPTTEPTAQPVTQTATVTTASLPTSIKIDNSNSKVKVTPLSPGALFVPSFSFDLDGDTVNDIVIKFKDYMWHGLHVQNSVEIETLGDSTFILTDSIYPRKTYDCNSTISVTNVNKTYPRGLVFNDTISIYDKSWRKGSFRFLYYDQEMDTLPCHKQYMEGYWYAYTQAHYVAIKCKGKLGWFKLRVNSTESFEFFECAMYKE